MPKIHKGDKVLVIAGKDRNKTGVVERVLVKKNKLIITGLNMVKKHMKKSQQYPQGGIIDKSQPLDISNVMLIDHAKAKPTRIGLRMAGKEKVRYSKLTGETITKGEAK